MKLSYIEKREIGLPEGYTKTEYPETGYTVYTWGQNGERTAAKIFGGKRSKPDHYYGFKDDFEMNNYINKFLQDRLQIVEQRANDKRVRKEQQDLAFKGVTVGDIFHQGGGYDQTNCHFYQLTKLKGKTGTFRSISMETIPGSEAFMSCREKPLPGVFTGKEFTARLTGDRMKPGYDCAYKCEATASFYHSWYA